MYNVLYNKALRHDPHMVRALRQPVLLPTRFPVYITALINSSGPYQLNDIRSCRMHVPYITYHEITAARPATCQTHHVTLFEEKT